MPSINVDEDTYDHIGTLRKKIPGKLPNIKDTVKYVVKFTEVSEGEFLEWVKKNIQSK